RLHAVRRERARCCGDERPDAAAAFGETCKVELAVAAEHRVRVDGERSDDFLDRRKLVARLEDPEPDRLAYLLDDLEVCRHSRLGLQVELDHFAPLSS